MTNDGIEIHLLDVGDKQYGDSILCVLGKKSVLIDGAHRGDDSLIARQIKAVLGKCAVELLVITHCHGDHIGCLPALITGGYLRCEWALLADPDLGYGSAGHGRPGDSFGAGRLLAALREEPLWQSSDEEIAMLLEDAVRQRDEYLDLIRYLRAEIGQQLVLWRGYDPGETQGLDALLAAFVDTGFQVLGPARAQLELAAARLSARAETAVPQNLIEDSAQVLVSAYRRIVDATRIEDTAGEADGAGLSCAVNNQSIVIACGAEGSRVLLTGDMQLAKPGMSGPEFAGAMEDLRRRIAAAGPYAFVKLAHHGSANGLNGDLLDQWTARDIGISTGKRSQRHPETSVIALLKERQHCYVRTSADGHCGWESGTPALFVSGPEPGDPEGSAPPPAIIRSRPWVSGPLGRGRELPNLLFVTDAKRLQTAIGERGAAEAMGMLNGYPVCGADLDEVRKRLAADERIQGVVLLGGPQVVPLSAVDVANGLDAADSLRSFDSDEWRIWSDAAYGRLQSGNETWPVSRIPDGGDAALLIRAMRAPAPCPIGSGAGIRNISRPFADRVFAIAVPAGAGLMRSVPVTHDQSPSYRLAGDLLYLVLHGDDDDGSYGYGESPDSLWPVAVRRENIPDPCPAVVVCGSCWGGLVAEYPYRFYNPAVNRPRGRDSIRSIALTCLERGANAFIGCTGTHYSPLSSVGQADYRWLAGPLHYALIEALRSGLPPSKALWQARATYREGMPYRRQGDENRLIEQKMLEVFTCLGLGW